MKLASPASVSFTQYLPVRHLFEISSVFPNEIDLRFSNEMNEFSFIIIIECDQYFIKRSFDSRLKSVASVATNILTEATLYGEPQLYIVVRSSSDVMRLFCFYFNLAISTSKTP